MVWQLDGPGGTFGERGRCVCHGQKFCPDWVRDGFDEDGVPVYRRVEELRALGKERETVRRGLDDWANGVDPSFPDDRDPDQGQEVW